MFIYKCSTCDNPKTVCLGHNGHIKLNKPIIHPLCHEQLIKQLEKICLKCKRITQTKCNNKCGGCGSDKNTYTDDTYNLGVINNQTNE
jgi:DNA-directed RNA polymerase beta' subunit